MQTSIFLTVMVTIGLLAWSFVADLKPTGDAFDWAPALSLILDHQPSED